MTLDVSAVRDLFPSLSSGIAHFDGPGGTQTPRAVGEAIAATLTGPLSNRGESVASERNATGAVQEFRTAMADLLGADPRGIVHGRSATQLTYDFSRHLAKDWGPGDEVVVSRLDHDCNVRPWVQAAEARGATVRWIGVDPTTAELDLHTLDEALSERTRLVAVTAASNLVGTMPPLARIAERVHAAGALLWVDGVHYTAHAAVDLAGLGADAFVCSPYKFLGPHCGVLAADPAWLETVHPDKLLPSPDEVPERFELGTLPYEVLAGVTAAVEVLADLAPGPATGRRARLLASHHALAERELALRSRIEEGLSALGGDVVLHSRAAERTPTLALTFPGRSVRAAARYLAERDVLAPAGTFYAHEPAHALGLQGEGVVRAGIAPYTSDDDVDRLLDGLSGFLADTPR
ncbi:cysteine desulfurase-like protein [Ornithinicoccus hortensis]|uniref:Cysteine desulfurase family protein (TIGR01976 family) n=1 Tax=Ornithinicoccus hortensis TaxID=82346 RepID=A0A542YS06_9MICO|nr:cysteine desulfurase-like protein [Ornithinicoccus hortensis]TQL50879.1 cysteine desulfurase family protein (TIGR01976 family) [Ornithinicoccus hortensis]